MGALSLLVTIVRSSLDDHGITLLWLLFLSMKEEPSASCFQSSKSGLKDFSESALRPLWSDCVVEELQSETPIRISDSDYDAGRNCWMYAALLLVYGLRDSISDIIDNGQLFRIMTT